MASVLHSELLYKAAKKMGLKAIDISRKKNRSEILIEGSDKVYVAKDSYIYPTLTVWARHFMDNKMRTQQFLNKKGYNTIPSHDMRPIHFSSESSFIEAVKKCKVHYPAITKTNVGTYGSGITFVSTSEELEKSCRSLYKRNRRFMIQEVTWDDEYRITLIHKKPIMVHKKQLPHITGNGRDTIAKLLEKQAEPLKDTNFIAWNLQQQSYSKKMILPKGHTFATHIIKKRTSEYYKTSNFPRAVVTWGKQLLKDVSAETVAIDFTAQNGLSAPSDFAIFEINANPHWTYVIDELNDKITPQKICEHILTSYFGK